MIDTISIIVSILLALVTIVITRIFKIERDIGEIKATLKIIQQKIINNCEESNEKQN